MTHNCLFFERERVLQGEHHGVAQVVGEPDWVPELPAGVRKHFPRDICGNIFSVFQVWWSFESRYVLCRVLWFSIMFSKLEERRQWPWEPAAGWVVERRAFSYPRSGPFYLSGLLIISAWIRHLFTLRPRWRRRVRSSPEPLLAKENWLLAIWW